MRAFFMLMFAVLICSGCSSGNFVSPREMGSGNGESVVYPANRDWSTGSMNPEFSIGGNWEPMENSRHAFLTPISGTPYEPEIVFQVDVTGRNGPSELRTDRGRLLFGVSDRGYLSGPEGAKYPFKSKGKVSFTFLSGTLPTTYETYAGFVDSTNPSNYHVLPASVKDVRTTAINNDYIVFSEYTQGIWIYTTDLVLVAHIKTHAQPSSWSPVISSGNDIVAFSSCAMLGPTDDFKLREIYVYDISASYLKRITLDPTAAMVEPSINANGTKIAFLRSPEIDGQYNTIQVVKINSDGSGYQVIDANGYNQFAKISGKGDVIVWSHNNDVMTYHGYSIRVWQNGITRDLTSGDKQNIYADIDDTGRWVAYSKEEGTWSDFQIHKIDLKTNTDRLVYDSPYWDYYPSL